MGKHLIRLVMLFFSITAYAQQAEPDNEVYIIVEKLPEYPGGKEAMIEHLSSMEYPAKASAYNWEGKTYVKFIIEKDGSVEEVEVYKSSGYLTLDNSAIDIVKSMPKWEPGMNEGKPVRVQFILPLSFSLPSEEPTDDRARPND